MKPLKRQAGKPKQEGYGSLVLVFVVSIAIGGVAEFLRLLFWHKAGTVAKSMRIGGWMYSNSRTEHCDIPRINSSLINSNQIRDLLRANVPFVLQGFAMKWKALEEWERDSLLQRFGNREVRVDTESSIVMGGGTVSKTMPFRGLLDWSRNCSEDYRMLCGDQFVFDTAILRSIPELKSDIVIPPMFSDWDNTRNEREGHTWHMLSLGPRSSGLPMHSHGKTWLTIIFATKSWYLYPPGFSLPNFAVSETSTLQSVADWKNTVPPLLQKLPKPVSFEGFRMRRAAVPAGGDTQPLFCQQAAGDVLFLPDLWSHLTFNEDETIAFGAQAALSPDLRFQLAQRALEQRPNDFEATKNAAIGLGHITVQQFGEIQRAVQSFHGDSSSRLLVVPSLNHLRQLVTMTEDIWVTVSVVSEEALHQVDESDGERYTGSEVLDMITYIADRFADQLNVAITQQDANLLATYTDSAGIPLTALRVSMDSKPILSSTVRYTPRHVSASDIWTQDVEQWVKDTIHVYYLESGAVLPLTHPRGMSRVIARRYQEVEVMLRSALKQRPGHLETWRLWAEIAGSLGDHDTMDIIMQNATMIFDHMRLSLVTDTSTKSLSGFTPKAYASVYHQLATSYLSVDRVSSSLPLLTQSLGIAPQYLPALVDMVVAYTMLRDRDHAEEAYQKLQESYPACPDLQTLRNMMTQTFTSLS